MDERAVRRARLLSAVTLVCCAVYVAVDVLAQILPPHYSPIHQAESDLAVGPYGFLMSLNFLLRGVLTVCLLSALAMLVPVQRRSWVGMISLGVWSVTSALLAVFPTDILDDPRLVPHPHPTIHGEIHLTLATLGFVAAALGAVLLSRSLRRVRDLAPGVFTRAVAWLSLAGLAVLPLSAVVDHAGGLGERFFLAAVLAWTAATALTAYRAAGTRLSGGRGETLGAPSGTG